MGSSDHKCSEIHDFGYGSKVKELTLAEHSDENFPTARMMLTVTFQVKNAIRRFRFINPEPVETVSSFMKYWAFKIFDRNLESGVNYDFGRYLIEYMYDDDEFPKTIQVDTADEMKVEP